MMKFAVHIKRKGDVVMKEKQLSFAFTSEKDSRECGRKTPP